MLLTLAEIEREEVTTRIVCFEFNMQRAAKSLGIAKSTLYRKLETYGLRIDRNENRFYDATPDHIVPSTDSSAKQDNQ